MLAAAPALGMGAAADADREKVSSLLLPSLPPPRSFSLALSLPPAKHAFCSLTDSRLTPLYSLPSRRGKCLFQCRMTTLFQCRMTRATWSNSATTQLSRDSRALTSITAASIGESLAVMASADRVQVRNVLLVFVSRDRRSPALERQWCDCVRTISRFSRLPSLNPLLKAKV